MNKTVLCSNLSLLANFGDEIGFHDYADSITEALESFSNKRYARFNLMKTLGLSGVEKALRKYWKPIFTIAAMYYGGTYIFQQVLGIRDPNIIRKLLFDRKSLVKALMDKKGLDENDKDDADDIRAINTMVDSMYNNANANIKGVAKNAIQSGQIPGVPPGSIPVAGSLPPAGQTTTNAGLSQAMSTLSSQSVSKLRQITDSQRRKQAFETDVMPQINKLATQYASDKRINNLKNELINSIKMQSGVS